MSRFWKVIQNVTVSGFVEFMKRNIVGSVILLSLAIWVPFSCCIHFCIDKRYRTIQRQKVTKDFQRFRSQDNEHQRMIASDDQEEIN